MESAEYHPPRIKTHLEGLNRLDLEGNGKASAHETAKKLIKTGIAPIIELQRAGVLDGVRVAMFGGTVYKPNPPKDYDVVAIYDEAHKPQDLGNLSDEAKKLLAQMFPKDGEKPKRVDLEIDIYDKTDWKRKVSPQYIELWLMSKDEFEANLAETPEEVKQRAFYTLSSLPEAITSPIRFLDGLLYTDEAEEADRNPAILYTLVLGKIFGHKFSLNEVSNMARFPSEGSKFGDAMKLKELASLDDPKKEDEIAKRTDKFIREDVEILEKKLSIETVQKLRDFLDERLAPDELIPFATDLTNEYSSAIPMHDERARTRWIYQGIISGTNPEMGAVDTGLLIYGPNIEENGNPLFKEDKEFLGRRKK